MEVKFALNSQQAIEALGPELHRSVQKVTNTMKHAKNLSELLRSLQTKSTTFEQIPVFIAKADLRLRIIFTEKNNKIFILSLIDKDSP